MRRENQSPGAIGKKNVSPRNNSAVDRPTATETPLPADQTPAREVLIIEQLEDELRTSSWITCTATSRFVFDVEPGQVWSELLLSMGPHYAHLVTMPLDPRVN